MTFGAGTGRTGDACVPQGTLFQLEQMKARCEMSDLQKNVVSDQILTLQQEQILAGVTREAPSKLRTFLRAYAGAASKREAIKAKCLDCSNLTVDEVRNCPATGCALWRYRPYQVKG